MLGDIEHDAVVVLELALEIAVLVVAEIEEEGAARLLMLIFGGFQIGDLEAAMIGAGLDLVCRACSDG